MNGYTPKTYQPYPAIYGGPYGLPPQNPQARWGPGYTPQTYRPYGARQEMIGFPRPTPFQEAYTPQTYRPYPPTVDFKPGLRAPSQLDSLRPRSEYENVYGQQASALDLPVRTSKWQKQAWSRQAPAFQDVVPNIPDTAPTSTQIPITVTDTGVPSYTPNVYAQQANLNRQPWSPDQYTSDYPYSYFARWVR